MFLIFAKEGRD